MPAFLSAQQVARYRRFIGEPSPPDLERFFRLDEADLALVASRRRDYNRLGFALQLGTVRMLGTFLSEPCPGFRSS